MKKGEGNFPLMLIQRNKRENTMFKRAEKLYKKKRKLIRKNCESLF